MKLLSRLGVPLRHGLHLLWNFQVVVTLYAWRTVSLLRRLFSTFARGWPGVGLLLLRLIAAVALVHQGTATLQTASWGGIIFLAILMIAAAIFLLAGLWTPVAGVLALIVELGAAFTEPGDHWLQILLGTLGAGLALVGPGIWSVDARLFGWKRIVSRSTKS